jgi:hypothetical protein
MALLLAPAAAAPGSKSPEVDPDELAPTETEERVMPGIPADVPLASGNRAPAAVGDPGNTDVPTVEYDADKLPTPVRRLREQIMEAAATGDPDKLRPIIEANGEPPALSYNDIGDDPVEYLRSLSADPEGREILAILIEMLESGYVHVGEGTPDEMYVWPYFAHYPVDQLSGPQVVELLKIVFPGDLEDMRAYGHYLFYRVGLAPDGTWRYFIAGD